MDVDRIVVLNTSNGPTTNGNSGSTSKPGPVGSLQKIQNGAQGSTQLHSLHRLNVAVIGGLMAGIFVLLLLIILAVVLFHRRGVRQGRLRPMWQPRTPNLPMQVPSPWGTTPRTAEAPHLFLHPSDAEKVVGHPVPIGPQENPFTDDARVELPSVPEMSMVREGNNDGRWSGTRQVKSSAVRQVSSQG
jgi:hypothetical protein